MSIGVLRETLLVGSELALRAHDDLRFDLPGEILESERLGGGIEDGVLKVEVAAVGDGGAVDDAMKGLLDVRAGVHTRPVAWQTLVVSLVLEATFEEFLDLVRGGLRVEGVNGRH